METAMSSPEYTATARPPARRWQTRATHAGAALLLAGLAAGAAEPAAAQEICGTRADLLKELTRRYSEAPVAVGLANSGALVEILTNGNGSTWSIMVSQPNGTSCLVAAGKEWQDLKPDVAGRDLRV
jgi:hypothetical protein